MGSEDISPLIGDIYDAAIDARRWPKVLERLTAVFGSSSAHLSVEHPVSMHGKIVSFGTDAAYARSYADYYVTRNVLWHRLVQQSLDGILTDRIIMPKEELQRSEFYNDFLRPQDGEEILCSAGLHRGNGVTNLTLWRPERHGAWQSEQMETLAKITPHFRRALRVNERIGALQMTHEFAGEALYRLSYGIMLVDAEALVCFANKAAETALDIGGGLRLECRRLSAVRASDTEALHRLIAEATLNGSGGSHVICREERPPLLITIIPLRREHCPLTTDRNAAMVLIRDLERTGERSLDLFADYYGLTPAQKALAAQLINGDGVTAAAMRLGISSATVRTHLVHIFGKTGTKRQAELVRLMLEWAQAPAGAGRQDRHINTARH